MRFEPDRTAMKLRRDATVSRRRPNMRDFRRSVIRRNADLAGRSNGSVDNRTVAPGLNTIDEAAGLHHEGTYRRRLRIEQTSALGSIIPRNNPPPEAQAIILARFL